MQGSILDLLLSDLEQLDQDSVIEQLDRDTLITVVILEIMQ